MASYLVEAYTPQPTSLEDIERSLSRAVGERSALGSPVRYLRSIYVAEDEICFHLFEAGSVEDVRRAAQRARLDAQRIVEAIEMGARVGAASGGSEGAIEMDRGR